MAERNISPGLYAITDTRLLPGERLFTEVAAAIRGGAVVIQYRDKVSSPRERLYQAGKLQVLCAGAGVPLLINDDPKLALEVGAAGVHLGQSDFSLERARAMLGSEAIIGATCHGSLSLARQAVEASADYLAFGRFFGSQTKPEAVPAEPGVLAEAKQLDRPLVAIGGITAENGAQLIRAGADCLAVIGGLFASPDTEQAARELSRLISAHHPAAPGR
ncbi:thiamine phosphate synthase [Marinobacter salicampi]|uniref:thiamine phosphate synthase n=1 Tax=Marinobacter salicampi TaxID=435907 RepID=UPI001A951424|nr:thiamine phosphate synthase [Marinobacter salicampi]